MASEGSIRTLNVEWSASPRLPLGVPQGREAAQAHAAGGLPSSPTSPGASASSSLRTRCGRSGMRRRASKAARASARNGDASSFRRSTPATARSPRVNSRSSSAIVFDSPGSSSSSQTRTMRAQASARPCSLIAPAALSFDLDAGRLKHEAHRADDHLIHRQRGRGIASEPRARLTQTVAIGRHRLEAARRRRLRGFAQRGRERSRRVNKKKTGSRQVRKSDTRRADLPASLSQTGSMRFQLVSRPTSKERNPRWP